MHIPKRFRERFQYKGIDGHIVGYVNERDGYRVWVRSQAKVVLTISHDVTVKQESSGCNRIISRFGPEKDPAENPTVTLQMSIVEGEDQVMQSGAARKVTPKVIPGTAQLIMIRARSRIHW